MPIILCVDDSPRTLRLLSVVLHSCGYQVLTSCDPKAALDVAAHSAFDLAILDYQLPNTTGVLLASAIKKINPAARIMLFSGALPLLNGGCEAIDEYVPKGESIEVMLHKIRSLVQPSRSHAPNHTPEPLHAG